MLVEAGFVVIACSGGRISVIEQGTSIRCRSGHRQRPLRSAFGYADCSSYLYHLNDVAAVFLNYGTPKRKMIREITSGKLKNYLRNGECKEGSTGTKVEVAIKFVEAAARLQ